MCLDFLRASEPRQDGLGFGQRAGRIHSPALASPWHPQNPRLQSPCRAGPSESPRPPAPSAALMTFSRWTSPRELRRGGAGPGGQVRRQRSLRGEAGTLPRSALLSLLGVLQIPRRWGQGRQFYCRRLYEPELRLGGESGTQNLGAAQDGASPRVHWAASGSAE